MKSSAINHTVDEVFGITRHLPLNYVERPDVDGRLRDELTAAHHVVIYGSSKQGKTSLRKRCMDSSEYILVQCSNRSDIADLHSNILKRAGFEITLSQKRSSSGRHKVIASLKAAMKATFFGQGVQMEGAAGAERETTTGIEHTTAALELDIDDVNDVIAALQGIGFCKKIVLEDFHYLEYQVQRDFSVELKAFHEASDITFVIVGVWLEDNRLIVYNGDLTGRVVSINADRWNAGELREAIDTGAALLGVSFAAVFTAALIVLARESIYVVQEVCRRACLNVGVRHTRDDNPLIGADLDVDALVKQVVDEQSARYDGFLSTFADGFQETELGRHHPVFRYCRQCVLLGHHSVTYQMFSENRCPAHQRKLETQCHRCGRETPYILNARLVGSPYRCAQCGELYASQSPPAFSAKPAMRKEHRIAIARHFHNRMAGSFCLGKDERNL